MILSWLRKKPEPTVEVVGERIIVTLPGTTSRVVYSMAPDGKLVASNFTTSKEPGGITFSKFLALAWPAANAKAKEIGWIS